MVIIHFSWRVGILISDFRGAVVPGGDSPQVWQIPEVMRSRTDKTVWCGKDSPPGHWRHQEWVGQKKGQDPGSEAFPERERVVSRELKQEGPGSQMARVSEKTGQIRGCPFYVYSAGCPLRFRLMQQPTRDLFISWYRGNSNSVYPRLGSPYFSANSPLFLLSLSVNDLPPTHPNQKPGDHSRVLPLPHQIIISQTCFNPFPLLLCTLFQATITSHQFLCLVPLTRLPASSLSPRNPLSNTSGNHSSVGWIWNHSLHKKPIVKYLLCLSDSWIWKWIPEASRMGDWLQGIRAGLLWEVGVHPEKPRLVQSWGELRGGVLLCILTGWAPLLSGQKYPHMLAALEVPPLSECGIVSWCPAERPGGGEARWQDGGGENSGEGLAAAGKDQCLFPSRVCLCCYPWADERNSNSYWFSLRGVWDLVWLRTAVPSPCQLCSQPSPWLCPGSCLQPIEPCSGSRPSTYPSFGSGWPCTQLKMLPHTVSFTAAGVKQFWPRG